MRRGESGQAIVMVAILLALFMFTGLAVDAGQLFSARRTMQEAADSAAYAGAVVVYQGGTKSAGGACGKTTTDTAAQAYLAAVADATRNGFTDGVGGNGVTINNPPTSGPYCGNSRYVEVILLANVTTVLIPAESGLTAVRVRGVAGAEPLNNGFAIMALDRGSTPSAFATSPNADVHLTGGGILIDSTSASAASNQQTSCSPAPGRFTVETPYGVSIAGGTTSAWPNCGGTGTFPVNANQAQVPDPFAGFPKPSTTGLPVCIALNSSGCQDGSGLQNPGVYKVSLGGAAGTTITLNPGIYILEAGINEAGNADVRSRNDVSCASPPNPTNTCGVFLFNTTTNYPAPGGTCGPINLSGNGSSELYALKSGPYANFLVYQDPACTAPMTISGNGTFTGSGTVYLPTAGFSFNGNNATLTGSQLLAQTVDVQNGNITIDFTSGNTAQPTLPRLSE